ncbi:MAG TPA: hypothetical protein VMX76_01040 [Nevskiaceae bacterium]|nr:hypothetical protein [Nevskiaceae bacterium]
MAGGQERIDRRRFATSGLAAILGTLTLSSCKLEGLKYLQKTKGKESRDSEQEAKLTQKEAEIKVFQRESFDRACLVAGLYELVTGEKTVFSGMDYLERIAIWKTLHDQAVAEVMQGKNQWAPDLWVDTTQRLPIQ